MGVHSVCRTTTLSIPTERSAEALVALKKGISDLGFMGDRNIEFCSSLPEALKRLDFEFTVSEDAVNDLHFGGGKRDSSVFVLPVLAPYIADGGKLVMEHDGEAEVWEFNDGDFSHYADEEYDEEYDDDEDDEISDAAYRLFQRVEQRKFTAKQVADVVKKEGHLNFMYDSNTIMTRFMRIACDEINSDRVAPLDVPADVMEQFELLMQHQPNLNEVNYYGETALTIALDAGYFELAEKMLEAGASLLVNGAENPFFIAAEEGNLELLQFLLDKETNTDVYRGDLLVAACGMHDGNQRKQPFINFLVENLGADVNQGSKIQLDLPTTNLKKNATPLMAAAGSDDPDTAQYLLDRGADASATDSVGNTALHYCSGQTWYSGDGDRCWWAAKRNPDVVKLLAMDAKSIAAKNHSNESPYTLARSDNASALELFQSVLKDAGAPMPVELSDDLNGEVVYKRDGQLGYSLNFKDGNLDGRQELFHRSGETFAIVHFKEGKADGSYECQYEDGKPMLEATMKDGKWHGDVKMYGKDGTLGQHLKYDSGRRHGQQLLLNDDGSKIIDATYENGKKHGHFYFKKPGGDVVVDEEFVEGMPKKAADEEEKKPKEKGLAGLFGSILGMITGGFVGAELAEDMLKPSDKLFFHKQDKLFALFEKTQAKVLEDI